MVDLVDGIIRNQQGGWMFILEDRRVSTVSGRDRCNRHEMILEGIDQIANVPTDQIDLTITDQTDPIANGQKDRIDSTDGLTIAASVALHDQTKAEEESDLIAQQAHATTPPSLQQQQQQQPLLTLDPDLLQLHLGYESGRVTVQTTEETRNDDGIRRTSLFPPPSVLLPSLSRHRVNP